MATADALIGLGMPAELAIRLGFQPVSVTTTAATQGSAGGLLQGYGNKMVAATFASAGHAVTLPDEAEIGDEIIINNVSANAGIIFPPSGGNLNGETADASMAIAAQGSSGCVQRAMKVSATRWAVWAVTVS